MLPYFEIPKIHLFGPFAIQPFGLLVVIGIFFARYIGAKRSRESNIPEDLFFSALFFACIWGFLSAHVLDIVFYQPERLLKEGPLLLLKVWDGLSSYGGFIGGAAAVLVIILRHQKGRGKKVLLPYLDVYIQALVAAYLFGRLGCAVVHDHPGTLTDFPLAFRYDFGTRHNIGLYEFLYSACVLFPVTVILNRKKLSLPQEWKHGTIIGAVCLLYGPFRFLIDFLRANDLSHSDARYAGLTPAQYISLLLAGVGIWILTRQRFSDPKFKG